MSDSNASYRRILWATSVMGGATFAALVIGLIRNKAVALIGGPEAVGLFGLFTTIISMGGSIATLGLDTSAVRQLAKSGSDAVEAERTQRAIWTMAWPLALIGLAAVWLLRRPIAVLATGNGGFSDSVGLLALGVFGTVVAAAQLAILQGRGRVADLARVRVWGSLLATSLAVFAVYFYGVAGIAPAALAVPVVTAIVSLWYGRTVPASDWRSLRDGDLGRRWKALAAIGVVVMMTNGLVILNDLAMRSVVTHRLGLGDLGFYVASSAIVWVNLSLVLNAMAADYYPRLSSVADDPQALSVTLNQQWHVALLLAGPALAAVSVAAPLALALLYAPSFAQSALVLRLLAAAGLFRLAIWALGFVLLARRATWSYMAAEIASALAIPIAWAALPQTGLWGASAAQLLSSALSFVVFWRRVVSQGVSADRGNVILTAVLVVSLAALAALFELNRPAGYVAGIALTSILAWRSYGTIRAVVSR